MRIPLPILSALVVGVLLCPQARASDVTGDSREAILVPLSYGYTERVAGAFGTSWGGEVVLHNRSNSSVNIDACEPACPGYSSGVISILGEPLGRKGDRGMVFYLPEDQARAVTFASRIFETTMRTQPRGIEIPVIREDDFYSTTQSFLHVPSDSGVRVALRVYDPWEKSMFAPSVTLDHVVVEVIAGDRLDLSPGQTVKLGEFSMTPTVNYAEFPGELAGFVRSRPGLSLIGDLSTRIPSIYQYPAIHILVRPVPDGAHYWAMVSVSDNATQTVSIITAQ